MEETDEVDINPKEIKIFNQDVFNYNKETKEIKIIHSMIKFTDSIPCVLVLENNNTYGKMKDKFYYKCIPDDKRIPYFIVPYKIGGKNNKIGFNKNIKNKFVIIKYLNWNNKHPIGELVNVIGDVDILENFYEYQLYRKSLQSSIKYFTEYTLKKLKDHTEENYINMIMNKHKTIKDCRNRDVYTIDPIKAKDYDDAFSVIEKNDNIIISIYIANVYMWFDILDLWNAFSNRISTIYLPDKKRPMLPSVLSDSLCSLKESTNRFALVMDVNIDKDGNIINYNFYNALINVKKNYNYNCETLKNNDDYLKVMEFIQKMNLKTKYTSSICDSHDFISYLMTIMNYYCAKELIKYKKGVFRSFTINKLFNPPEHLDENIRKFLQYTKESRGVFELYSNEIKPHDVLEMDAYVNITSPIRRLVDILNMMILMENTNLINLNDNALKFLNNWLDRIDYINCCSKCIKKIQIDCGLLNLCTKDPNLYDKTFNGCVFDKILRSDGLYHYNIYLPSLKMLSRYVSRINYENYEMCKFKIYLFRNSDSLKQKIRIEAI
jgi:exoribonuclease R